MKKRFLPFLLSVFFLTSCVQTIPMVREKQVRVAESTAAIITEPMVLEIEYLSPLPLTDSTVFDISGYSSTEQVNASMQGFRQYALEEFAFKSEYDMIVNATFHSYTRTIWSGDNMQGAELVVVVSGYGIKYKQLRKATPDDVWMSNFGGHK